MSRPQATRARQRAVLGLAAVTLLAPPGCGGGAPEERRVIVLGVDGLDPEILMEQVAAGACPSFARLMEQGSFGALQTSWPPQSPVAWSNFITGCNPGRHGLFDFIHVDRRTYGVQNSIAWTEPVGAELHLFGYKLPLSGGEQHLTRAVPAFWEVLAEAGVPVAVYRIPANYPPAETEAVTFPDMGTPDLSGAASGRAFLWTDDPGQAARDAAFYSVLKVNPVPSPAHPALTKYYTEIYGPDNTLRDFSGLEDALAAAEAAGDGAEAAALRSELARERRTSAPLTAHVTTAAGRPQLAVELGGEWGIAELGGWTRWMPVEFELVPHLVSVSGWTRFLFRSAQPFALYGAPVQIDPWAPAMPVSTPEEASARLADAIGAYYTQGFPDAYLAYKSGLLRTGEFVGQSDTVLEERRRMLDYALDEFEGRGGLLFFYVGSMDMRCHMLWHCQDPAHPHQEPDSAAYAGEVKRIYQQVDELLGALLQRMEAWPGCELIVLSDHGFAPFRRQMHVNDWLVREGYLVLKPGVEFRGGELWRDGKAAGPSAAIYALDAHGEPDWERSVVDWSRTRAYSIGFNGVILNRAGREARGIVTEEEARPLLEELRRKLLDLRDADGTPLLTAVALADEVFRGPRTAEAPDLQLGFNAGYGASDESATGEITGDGVVTDNDSRWSGSHLMDPALVPGALLTSRKRGTSPAPRLEDVTATLYRLFEVQPPADLDGRSLF